MSLPVNNLTHVLYAFANCQQDGSVVLTDSWSDTDKRFTEFGDSWADTGNNVYGCFKRFGVLKRSNPSLKVLLSIGGWTLSTNFAAVAANDGKRNQFVTTAITLMNDLGLDGLDIDWEYPADANQGNDYLKLLQDCRSALTAYGTAKNEAGKPYLLSCAMPCGPDKYQRLPLGRMAQYLDTFNLMAYDFHGSWDAMTGHQANLYGPAPSGQVAVQDYIAAGVPAKKLVLGMPLYGRSFLNAENRVGAPFTGVGQGTWEPGVYDYKVLPLPGSTVQTDSQAVAAWCYDASKREFVSYDTAEVVRIKTQWAKQMGLGGIMFWEASGDRTDSASLIQTACDAAGGVAALDKTENHRSFPGSKYDNVKKGFA